LGNIFKTILKVIWWSKLPTFTVPIYKKYLSINQRQSSNQFKEVLRGEIQGLKV